MYNNEPYPVAIQVVALAVILAPTVGLLVFRRQIGTTNTAAGLVVWGALAACGEHGMWAMRLAIHERSWSEPHATVHYFMAGVYTAVAGVLLSVIALALLREGRRAGWFAVLFVTLVGGGFELAMNGPAGYLYHHIGLYGYPLAWLAALVITYKPIFVRGRAPASRDSDRTLQQSPHFRGDEVVDVVGAQEKEDLMRARPRTLSSSGSLAG